jgi:hypothetical protein
MEDTKDFGSALSVLAGNVHQWEQRLAAAGSEPEAFRDAVRELRGALNTVGCIGFRQLALACETSADQVVRGGTVYRFKQDAPKAWLTPWGTVMMPRRLFQPDRGGPCWVPLDERCGMVDRFMVPELERVTCFLGARLVPAEVEESLSEVLPERPSRTAIQHVLAKVGQVAEDHAAEVEAAIQATAPLDTDGDTLVSSWDGVTVPLREVGAKRGRPPERPGVSAEDEDGTTPTAWKEAGVGMVATYLTSLHPEDPESDGPERIDVRYSARMPETKMQTLVAGLVAQTEQALQAGFFQHHVLLADGKRQIWDTVDEYPVFDDFTRILDFYHATEHLSKAAEHLFGKGSEQAKGWFRKRRHKLRHEPGAVDHLLHSISYHRRKLRRGTCRYEAVSKELGFFRRNADKMDYARLRTTGLPISSGTIEAAAKTVVAQRLKRSGMRWLRPKGQQILNLRVQVQSKRWHAFWKWYLDHTDHQAKVA